MVYLLGLWPEYQDFCSFCMLLCFQIWTSYDGKIKASCWSLEDRASFCHTNNPALRGYLCPFSFSFLAGKWVQEMGGSVEDEPVEASVEARPPRLGLGAAVPRTSTFKPSNDPVERKLQMKLKYAKKRAADKEESTSSTKKEPNDEDDDDDDPSESRSAAFSKKRAAPVAKLSQGRKKSK